MNPRRPQDFAGTVSLVALCFVAVLGISLASYLTICSRSMTISNRTFQSGLGQQLAELGLEEGMRAFNKGDWANWSSVPSGITSSAWTLDTTNKRASRTLTFDTTRLGQNVTATVKIRIDNYDANALGSTYNSSTTYRINDLVYYSGTANTTGNWYRSVYNGHSNNTPANSGYPNLAYWVPAPIPWMWNSNLAYAQYSVVNYNGTWYRCHTATTAGLLPTNTSNWSYIPALSLDWTSGISYPFGTMLFDAGVWYYCISAHTSSVTITPTNTTYWAPVLKADGTAATPGGNTFVDYEPFSIGDYLFRGGGTGWLRLIAPPLPYPPYTYTPYDYNAGPWVYPSSSTTLPYISWMWRSGVTYSYNDFVYYSASGSGTWYRCKVASATSVPTTTADWENALTGANTTTSPGAHGWSSSSINYNPGDMVCYYTSSSYNFYRCTKAHTSSGSILPTNTTYWATTPLLSQDWQPNHQYTQYDTARYKGIWYLCLSSNNGQIPNVAASAYWAAAPQGVSAWNSTTYYELDDIVSSSGTWYRCIAPHKNHTAPNATYWTVLTGSGSSYVWAAGTAYTSGQYRSYGGVWYKCTANTAANDGHSPNDTAYWNPTWAQPSNTSVTTGAPVVYAEAAITIAGNPANRTQLRATIAPAPLFPNAAGATSTLTANSGGTIDSYDGSVNAIAAGGTYTANTYGGSNIGYTATIAAAGTSSPSLTLTSPTVKGYVAATPATSSPYAPLASYGTSAYLQNSDGTVTSPDASATHIDLTRVSRSPYIPLFDPLPSGGLAATWANVPKGTPLLSSATVNIGTPGATTPSRYYYPGDLTMGGGTSVITTMNINGPVILYINGDLILNGSPAGRININDKGSAEIHASGGFRIYSTSDGINNQTLDSKRLILISDNTSAQQFYNSITTPLLYSVIYAPNTTDPSGFQFNSGGGSSTTLYGAVSAAKITYINDMNIHYDTSLRYATFGGVDQPYTVTQWRELPQIEQATMP